MKIRGKLTLNFLDFTRVAGAIGIYRVIRDVALITSFDLEMVYLNSFHMF